MKHRIPTRILCDFYVHLPVALERSKVYALRTVGLAGSGTGNVQNLLAFESPKHFNTLECLFKKDCCTFTRRVQIAKLASRSAPYEFDTACGADYDAYFSINFSSHFGLVLRSCLCARDCFFVGVGGLRRISRTLHHWAAHGSLLRVMHSTRSSAGTLASTNDDAFRAAIVRR